MRQHFKSIPNQLTAARLVMIPVMWALTLMKLPVSVGIGMILSFATDVLDGFVARKLGQASEFGSKFDSLVDNLLLPSALVWLWLLRPEVYREHIWLGVFAITLYFSSLLLGLIKFRRFANLHLYSSKVSSVFMYLFISHAFIAAHYSPLLFYIATGMFVVTSAESLALQLISSKVDAHMGSIILVWRRHTSRSKETL